jgi:putative hydrolase of the HAD superfamily
MVLVSFNHDLCINALAAASSATPAELARVIEVDLRPSFERGELTPEGLYEYLCKRFKLGLEMEAFFRVWADVFTPVPETTQLLKELSGKVQQCLLSNTDAIHFPWIRDRWDFIGYLDHVVVSYEVHARKPDSCIYQEALARTGAQPEDCLFVDDVREYVDAATGLGIHGHCHLDPLETVRVVNRWIA